MFILVNKTQGFQEMHSELNGKSTLVWFLKQQRQKYKVYISFHFLQCGLLFSLAGARNIFYKYFLTDLC